MESKPIYLFSIEESVSGEHKIIKAESPIKALIQYLQEEYINEDNTTFSWDFEVHRLFEVEKV